MDYIIFDMEWNQPVPADRPAHGKPRLKRGEIIQIGFFALDEKLGIKHSEKMNIKPVCYTVMNKYVSALTGITQKDIDSGLGFIEALDRMKEHFGEDTVLLTWGEDDMPLLRENLKYHRREDYPLPARHYNLQRIYAAQMKTAFRQTALKTAVESLGIDVDVQAHEALNDAYMTVLVARKLDIERGIAEYSAVHAAPDKRSAQQPWSTAEPLCSFPVEYDGGFDGMANKCRQIRLTCPVCGGELSGSVLCRQAKFSFISCPECAGHGKFFVRYVLKNSEINVSCFNINEDFDRIYTKRMADKERKKIYHEMYRIPKKKKTGNA